MDAERETGAEELAPTEKFLLGLLDVGAFSFRRRFPFRSGYRLPLPGGLAELKPVPFQMDLSFLGHTPRGQKEEDLQKLAVDLAKQGVWKRSFDLLAPVSTSTIRFVEALATSIQVEMVIPGIRRNDSGRANRALMISGETITGGEELKAARLLDNRGFEVIDALTLFDHNLGASKRLADKGYNLYPIFTIIGALDWYVKHGKMKSKNRDVIQSWIANTANTINLLELKYA